MVGIPIITLMEQLEQIPKDALISHVGTFYKQGQTGIRFYDKDDKVLAEVEARYFSTNQMKQFLQEHDILPQQPSKKKKTSLLFSKSGYYKGLSYSSLRDLSEKLGRNQNYASSSNKSPEELIDLFLKEHQVSTYKEYLELQKETEELER